jgi:hypothetical protein
MATPQSPEQMAAAVDRISSNQMGVEQQQPKQDAKPSSQEKASEQGSPQTEGDKSGESPVVYSIDFGNGQKRDLTPQQIKSTFDRYAALNHQNAQLKPIQDLLKKAMAQTGESPAQMAQRLAAMQKAQQSNAQMGNTQGDRSGPPYPKDQGSGAQGSDLDATLKKWEEENAASLPPGYRDMMVGSQQSTQRVEQELAKTQQMLRQVLAQSQGNVDAARQGMSNANQRKAGAIQQQISNNVNRSQQALKLPDEKAQDFMLFAAERGYTMEDFADLQLTYKVMSDFRNNMDSPEMERMRQIAQKRQAFTGSLGSTPQSGPAADAPSENRFDQFASAAMSKRGM